MAEQRAFIRADALHYLKEERNWGRWGPDDEVGAVNLVTADKTLCAASLVRTGQSFSLSRPFPTEPSPINPRPAIHYTERRGVLVDVRPAANRLSLCGRAVTRHRRHRLPDESDRRSLITSQRK